MHRKPDPVSGVGCLTPVGVEGSGVGSNWLDFALHETLPQMLVFCLSLMLSADVLVAVQLIYRFAKHCHNLEILINGENSIP